MSTPCNKQPSCCTFVINNKKKFIMKITRKQIITLIVIATATTLALVVNFLVMTYVGVTSSVKIVAIAGIITAMLQNFFITLWPKT